MKLEGRGTATIKTGYNMGQQDRKKQVIFGKVGSGTIADPTVGWLFNVAEDRNINEHSQQDHVEIAWRVARRNGFRCILIRKEAHTQQCTYTAIGRRVTVTMANGRVRNAMAPADNHMTVWMGPNTEVAHVGGHIYVRTEVRESRKGRPVLRQITNPAKERRFVKPGESPVAEEFWLTKNTSELRLPRY
jgi:hypothetical protein